MLVLSTVQNPDNLGSLNFLQFSFTKIQGLCCNFVSYESFFELNSLDTLASCETNSGDSIDSSSISVRAYLPLISKNSITHILVLALHEKRDFLLHITCPYNILSVPNYVFE